ncbi:MAG TPA: energy transducer TonB [Gammaproteobacteria bacterium]|nr:energy transducer TonB [Gammaproteobacteria bacterium]
MIFQIEKPIPAMTIAVLLHGVVLAVLLRPDVAPPLSPPRPLMVSLIMPAPEVSPPSPAKSESAEPIPAQPIPALAVQQTTRAPKRTPKARPSEKPVQKEDLIPSEPVPDPAIQETSTEPEQILQASASAQPQPVISPPRFDAGYLDNPAPPYPPLSRRLSEEGQVLLRVLVDEQGQARTVEVDATSGFPRLDNAAVQAVQRWRFLPAKRGEEPVSEWVVVPIMFNLRG